MIGIGTRCLLWHRYPMLGEALASVPDASSEGCQLHRRCRYSMLHWHLFKVHGWHGSPDAFLTLAPEACGLHEVAACL